MDRTVEIANRSTRRVAGWRRLWLLALLLIAVVSSWKLTATWGVSDVILWLDRDAQGLNQELGPLKRIKFDPDVRPSLGETELPWYFIGNASSPCPFIVAVDFAYIVAGNAGQRSRVYCLWIFGVKIPLYESVDWMS